MRNLIVSHDSRQLFTKECLAQKMYFLNRLSVKKFLTFIEKYVLGQKLSDLMRLVHGKSNKNEFIHRKKSVHIWFCSDGWVGDGLTIQLCIF